MGLRLSRTTLEEMPADTDITFSLNAGIRDYNEDGWWSGSGRPSIDAKAGEIYMLYTEVAFQTVSPSNPLLLQTTASHFLKFSITPTDDTFIAGAQPETSMMCVSCGVQAEMLFEYVANITQMIEILQDCTMTVGVQFTTEYTANHSVKFGSLAIENMPLHA